MEHLLLIEDDQALGRGSPWPWLLGTGSPIWPGLWPRRRLFAQLPISLVILDLNLPDGNGLELLTEIRSVSQVPVLILTANDLESDQVTGLELGADDYVTKPFSLAVLRARVNNLLRRGAVPRGEVVELPPFSFDFAGMAFSRNGEAIELSKTEQRLLRLLVEHPGPDLDPGAAPGSSMGWGRVCGRKRSVGGGAPPAGQTGGRPH